MIFRNEPFGSLLPSMLFKIVIKNFIDPFLLDIVDSIPSSKQTTYNSRIGVCIATFNEDLPHGLLVTGILFQKVEGPLEGNYEPADTLGADWFLEIPKIDILENLRKMFV